MKRPVSLKPIEDLLEAMEPMMDSLPENTRKIARDLRECVGSGESRAKLLSLTLELLSSDQFKADAALAALLHNFNDDISHAAKVSGLNIPIGDDFDADLASNRFLRGFAEIIMASAYGDRRAIMENLSGPNRVSIVKSDDTAGLPRPVLACLVAMDECVVNIAATIEKTWETMDRAVQKEKKETTDSATDMEGS